MKYIADVLRKPEGSCHLPAYLRHPLPQGASAHGRMGRLSLDRPSSAGSEQQPGSPHGVLGALKKTGASIPEAIVEGLPGQDLASSAAARAMVGPVPLQASGSRSSPAGKGLCWLVRVWKWE